MQEYVVSQSTAKYAKHNRKSYMVGALARFNLNSKQLHPLAQEVAKRNITVNAVAPGFIRTDMTGELDEKELIKMIPVNRFGEAEEVADLVGFLTSKKAGYITGEVININGGIYP